MMTDKRYSDRGLGGVAQGVAQQESQGDGSEPKGHPFAERGRRERGLSLPSILGGDILTTNFLRRQIWLLVLVVVFSIFYISNRYSCQQEMIEIDRLKRVLTDIKYDALTRSSELTEKSRQSHIEEYVSNGGSALETSKTPPYLIR